MKVSKEQYKKNIDNAFDRADKNLGHIAKGCWCKGFVWGLGAIISARFALKNAISYGRCKGVQLDMRNTKEQLVDGHEDYWYTVDEDKPKE